MNSRGESDVTVSSSSTVDDFLDGVESGNEDSDEQSANVNDNQIHKDEINDLVGPSSKEIPQDSKSDFKACTKLKLVPKDCDRDKIACSASVSVTVTVVQGSNDQLVPVERVKAFATFYKANYIEVDDDHYLGTLMKETPEHPCGRLKTIVESCML